MNGSTDASTSASSSSVGAAADQPEDVTLSALLVRTLASSSKLLDSSELSTTSSQSSLSELLSNLSLCASLVSHLQLLSPNETIDELPTGSLRALLVEYYTGMLELQRRTRDYNGRKEVLKNADIALKTFLARCESYELVDEDRRRTLFLNSSGGSGSSAKAAQSNDPARRREAKIAQYKEERALKAKLEVGRASNMPLDSTNFIMFERPPLLAVARTRFSFYFSQRKRWHNKSIHHGGFLRRIPSSFTHYPTTVFLSESVQRAFLYLTRDGAVSSGTQYV